jgi:hypothetical protein
MGASTDGLLSKDGGCGETPGEEIEVGGAGFGGRGMAGLKPFVGNLREDLGDDLRIETAGCVSRSLLKARGPGQKDMVADVGEGGVGEAIGVGPVVVKVERRAVVDEVELTVPVQEIRVASGAVDVQDESIEPDGEGGCMRFGLSPAAGSNIEEPGR